MLPDAPGVRGRRHIPLRHKGPGHNSVLITKFGFYQVLFSNRLRPLRKAFSDFFFFFFLMKRSMHVPRVPAAALTGIYPRKRTCHRHTKTCFLRFMAAFFVIA